MIIKSIYIPGFKRFVGKKNRKRHVISILCPFCGCIHDYAEDTEIFTKKCKYESFTRYPSYAVIKAHVVKRKFPLMYYIINYFISDMHQTHEIMIKYATDEFEHYKLVKLYKDKCIRIFEKIDKMNNDYIFKDIINR